MITRNTTFTGLLCPNNNQLAKCSHRVHMKPGSVVEMSAKLIKMNLLEKFKLIKESKAKSLRNLGSQFGISVGAVNNFLKRKREYKNLGDPLG